RRHDRRAAGTRHRRRHPRGSRRARHAETRRPRGCARVMRRRLPADGRLAPVLFTLFMSACASAPPAPPPAPAGPTYEEKIASILRLEDQRVLRDPAPPVATAPAPPARGQRPVVVAPPPPLPPDLLRLVADGEPRVR